MSEEEKRPFGDARNFGDVRNTKNITTAMYEGDFELLEYIAKFLGCSRSEATRSAVRAFAANLSQIEGRK